MIGKSGLQEHPAPSDWYRLGYLRANHVWDDYSRAKAREDCQPFTFTLHELTEKSHPRAAEGQEQFTSTLAKLLAKQAREAAKRAKANR